jgi:hypothetical protein
MVKPFGEDQNQKAAQAKARAGSGRAVRRCGTLAPCRALIEDATRLGYFQLLTKRKGMTADAIIDASATTIVPSRKIPDCFKTTSCDFKQRIRCV